jgi:uncharacterized protein YecT (DUF1311 family)
MKKNISAIATVILLACLTPSYADESPMNDALINDVAKRENVSAETVKKAIEDGCDSGVTKLMNECVNYHYAGADIQLNRAYQILMKRLTSKNAKLRLKELQKAWIVQRDATCNSESESWEGGSGYHVAYTICLQSQTEERTEQLEEYLNCKSKCPWD